MPGPDFFARFGLFVRPGFFDAATCHMLIGEVRRADRDPARVYLRRSEAPEVDVASRKTAIAEVPERIDAVVTRPLEEIRPEIERHFRLTLGAHQPIDFLVYGPGDYFGAHTDGGAASHPESQPTVLARQVSVVIFLNDASAETPAPPGQFSGGELTFQLLDDPRAKTAGFPLDAETGLLIAFRSELMHEVKPVLSGERYTVVTFFE